MNISFKPSLTGGPIKAIASKSAAHRIAILSAFADSDTRMLCRELNEDIEATLRCMSALGANIRREGEYINISPVRELCREAVLDCGESGSTLRFLLPVVAMLGADATFLRSGRLPQRPLSPLREELEAAGAVLTHMSDGRLLCGGCVDSVEFSICGDVSSQFISGLLLGLAVTGRSGRVNILGELQSAPYVDITAQCIRAFGVTVKFTDGAYVIDAEGGLRSPREITVEGDWSNAAFPLALGAVGEGAVSVLGLDMSSAQGDKRIIDILVEMGGRVERSGGAVTVSPSRLRGIRIDASQIPDLVPILAVLGALAEGETVIYNAERLRIKESDRLAAVCTVLSTLGANIEETADGLRIVGTPYLRGGTVSSFGDHRIAMSVSVASVSCRGEVRLTGAEAVAKSYPSFFEDMRALGMTAEVE